MDQHPQEAPQTPTPITPENPPVQQPVVAQAPVYAQPPHAPANGLAIAGMVVGIVSIVCCIIPVFGLLLAVVALVLSIIAIRKPNGLGMSVTGIVTGGLSFLIAGFITVMFIIGVLAAMSISNEAIERSKQAPSTQEESSQEQLFN